MEAKMKHRYTGTLIWVAFDMFRDYFISSVNGLTYVSDHGTLKPKNCESIPDDVHYIVCPLKPKNP